MQSVISVAQPFEEVLLRENDIDITSSRAKLKKVTFSIKYVSKIELQDSRPSRFGTIMALILVVIAAIVLPYYLFTDRISTGMYIATTLLLLIIAALVIGLLWSLQPKHTLILTMSNGDDIKYSDRSELQIHKIYQALTAAIALNQQDPRVTSYLY